MRLGIIADIHGRYPALLEALTCLQSADAVANLGDVADFSPDVNRCYNLLKGRRIINLLGNHEQEALSNPSVSDDDVALLDEFGNERSPDFGVNAANKAFIAQSFKVVVKGQRDGVVFCFSHGFIRRHGNSVTFEYLSEDNLSEHCKKYQAAVSFCGHIHRSQVIRIREAGSSSLQEVESSVVIPIEENMTYGFNVGMLSQSRVDPAKLTYAILDTQARRVEYHL